MMITGVFLDFSERLCLMFSTSMYEDEVIHTGSGIEDSTAGAVLRAVTNSHFHTMYIK